MGMELGMSMGQWQRPELRIEQKLALKQMLELTQELRHEGFPDAVKGIEGMKVADGILKSKGLRGILIGGLSEAVHNRRNTRKDIDGHKDVDVLIPEMPEGVEIEDLEGGVDWWLPQDARIKAKYEASTVETDVRFWKNAFNTRLAFGVEYRYLKDEETGLYIPSPDFVIKMRMAEALSSIDSRVAVNVDGDVEELLEEKLGKRIKNERVGAVSGKYDLHDSMAVSVKPFDHEMVVAINGATEE